MNDLHNGRKRSTRGDDVIGQEDVASVPIASGAEFEALTNVLPTFPRRLGGLTGRVATFTQGIRDVAGARVAGQAPGKTFGLVISTQAQLAGMQRHRQDNMGRVGH